MRYCVINQDTITKEWQIGFFENHEIISNHHTTNYHEIGSWISNWITNRILPEVRF